MEPVQSAAGHPEEYVPDPATDICIYQTAEFVADKPDDEPNEKGVDTPLQEEVTVGDASDPVTEKSENAAGPKKQAPTEAEPQTLVLEAEG